ncbi:MAG: ATP-binding protein [Bacteroidales bacterium]
MSTGSKTARLELPNEISALERLTKFVDNLAEQWNLPDSLVMKLNLALEEAFTNIVNYAFSDDLFHPISVIFSKDNGLIRIELLDDGIAYDPTGMEDPDTQLPMSERKIGGLGIFLIKQMMDSVTYKREGDKNHLIIEKQC